MAFRSDRPPRSVIRMCVTPRTYYNLKSKQNSPLKHEHLLALRQVKTWLAMETKVFSLPRHPSDCSGIKQTPPECIFGPKSRGLQAANLRKRVTLPSVPKYFVPWGSGAKDNFTQLRFWRLGFAPYTNTRNVPLRFVPHRASAMYRSGVFIQAVLLIVLLLTSCTTVHS